MSHGHPYSISHMLLMTGMDREYLGASLSVAQRLAVRASLNKLKINEDNSNINFWGKISGSAKDYLIAVGTRTNESINKVFYFRCTSFPIVMKYKTIISTSLCDMSAARTKD